MQDFLINQNVISNLSSRDKDNLVGPNNLGKELLQAISHNLNDNLIIDDTKTDVS